MGSVVGHIFLGSLIWMSYLALSYCKAARTYFTSKNVPFVERDIEKTPQAEREYRLLGGKGVPLITVNNHSIQDFDKTGFKTVYLGEVEL